MRPPKVHPTEGRGLDRREFGTFLYTAERFDPDHAALDVLLGLNGLRVSEACGTNIEDFAVDRGHRTLRIMGKGSKPAVIPLVPRYGISSDGTHVWVTNSNDDTVSEIAVPLQITTTSLPEGTVGQPYSATVQAAGGNSPYRFWSVVGWSLPRGLHFDSFTGVLSGVPSKARNYTVTFRVRDTKIARDTPPNRATATFTIIIT